MGPPAPKFPLKDHCSVVHDNTLFTYMPTAFQSLELTKGAAWEVLTNGIAVSEAACVHDAAGGKLYVVGGTPNSTTTNYSGLQRFDFQSQKWESITPQVPVTQNRVGHGATFVNKTSSIFLYAGAQDGNANELSSQTFLLSTSPPYGVLSFTNNECPPMIQPLVLSYNDTASLVLGGDSTNTNIFTFSNDNGWQDHGVKLAQPLPNRSLVQAAIVNGDDGSKMLETFDMSVKPNSVSRIQLYPIPTGGSSPSKRSAKLRVEHAAEHTSSRKRKRDLTATNWPKYNQTLAPTTTRNGISLCQGADGTVVVTGGNDQDPLCMFDTRKNSWINATDLFTDQTAKVQSIPNPTVSSSSSSKATITPSKTSSSIPSATSSAAAAAAGSDASKRHAVTVLAATIGSIGGLFLLVLLFMFFYRRRKDRREKAEAGHLRRASGIPGDEKDGLSFADRGTSYMREATGTFRNGHNPSGSMGSMTSWSSEAIIAGRGRNKKNMFTKGNGSKGILAGKGDKGKSPLGGVAMTSNLPANASSVSFAPGTAVAAETMPVGVGARGPIPRNGSNAQVNGEGTNRSSGWSRYFSRNSETNAGASQQPSRASAKSTYTDASRSSYGDTHYGQESMTIPPLQVARHPLDRSETEESFSKVTSSTPKMSHHDADMRGLGFRPSEPMSAEIGRSNSNSTGASYEDLDHFPGVGPQHYGNPFNNSAAETWNPVDHHAERHLSDQSSVYTDNGRPMTQLPQPDTTGTFPSGGTITDINKTSRPNAPSTDVSWLNIYGDRNNRI
jgi:Galactose oxidase, central domain